MTSKSYFDLMAVLVLLIVFFTILLICYDIIRNYKINKKFDLITIRSVKQKDNSLKNTLSILFKTEENFIINIFSKSKLIKEYSKKYNRYNVLGNNNLLNFLRKFEVGLLFSIIYLMLSILEFKSFNLYIYIIIFIVSSYLMDLSLEIRLRERNKKVKDSLYDAINLLNKCFKSGKSINSSIEYLSKELNGPIQEEFELVLNDLNHGLSLKESFDRINERVNSYELKYITTSLSLISNNGGNISQLFDRILEDMLRRKKENDEFKSILTPTKYIYKILLIIPLILFILNSLLHNNYFKFFTTNLIGILSLSLLVSIYIFYIIIVNKIIKGVK